MPLTPLSDFPRRYRRVGEIRPGDFDDNANRPTNMSTWRFTSSDRALLESVARMYRGEILPWDKTPGDFELISEATEIYVELLPGTRNMLSYELYGKSGLSKKCDGQTCVQFTENGMVECPCSCEDDTPKKQKCSLSLKFDVKLSGTTGFGVWSFTSHSFYAATEMPQLIELLLSTSPLPLCILAKEFREIKRKGEATKQFYVPCIRVRAGMADELRALGGVSLQGVLAAEQARVLAFNSVTPVIEGGAPQLPASTVEVAAESGGSVTVDAGTGEVLEPKVAEAKAAEPKEPKVVDPLDAEVKEVLTGFDLFKKEVKPEADKLKERCAAANLDWRKVVIDAAKTGAVDFAGFGKYLDSLASKSPEPAPTVPVEDEYDPFKEF